MAWTPERIEELTQLGNAGHSASTIGKQLGVSKNAVVGKAHRLKLPARPSPIRRKAKSPTPARKPAPSLTPPAATPAAAVAVPVREQAKPRPPLIRPSALPSPDRKSTRLNSSHVAIPYAVFCLNNKKDSRA